MEYKKVGDVLSITMCNIVVKIGISVYEVKVVLREAGPCCKCFVPSGCNFGLKRDCIGAGIVPCQKHLCPGICCQGNYGASGLSPVEGIPISLQGCCPLCMQGRDSWGCVMLCCTIDPAQVRSLLPQGTSNRHLLQSLAHSLQGLEGPQKDISQ